MIRQNNDNILEKLFEVTFYGVTLIAIQRFFDGSTNAKALMVASSFLAIITFAKLIWPLQLYNKRGWVQMGCVFMCGICSWWLIHTVENTRMAYYRLNIQRQKIESVIKSGPFYSILSDSDGLITSTSNNIELLTGWQPSELIGQPLTVLMLDGQSAKYQVAYDKAIALLRDPYSVDQGWLFQGLVKVPLKHKNGNVVPVKIFSFGIRWSTDVQFKGDTDVFAVYFPVDPKEALEPPTNLRFIEGRELQKVPDAPPVKTLVPTPVAVPVHVPRNQDDGKIIRPR